MGTVKDRLANFHKTHPWLEAALIGIGYATVRLIGAALSGSTVPIGTRLLISLGGGVVIALIAAAFLKHERDKAPPG